MSVAVIKIFPRIRPKFCTHMSGDTIPGRFIHWHRKLTTGLTEMFSKPYTAHLKERGFEPGTTT